jgi:hypothetical protein
MRIKAIKTPSCDVCHKRWPTDRPDPRKFWASHYLGTLASWFTRARHTIGCSMPSKLRQAVSGLWYSLKIPIMERLPRPLQKRLKKIASTFNRMHNRLSNARQVFRHGRRRLWERRRNGFRSLHAKFSMMRKKLWTKRLGLLYHLGEFICVVGARFKLAGGSGMTDSSSASLRRAKSRQSLEAEFDDEDFENSDTHSKY